MGADDEDARTSGRAGVVPVAGAPRAPRAETELSDRGIARLTALADWIDGAAPSSAVVALVRAFLHDVTDVGAALDTLLLAAGDGPAVPEVHAALHSLAIAIGLWRTNLVEHVDDLALSDHRSFAGWSSLPEYSSAYTLAIVRPALAEVEAWAQVRGNPKRGGAEKAALVALVRSLGASIERLNATLRRAILGASEPPTRHRGSLASAAW